MDVHATDTSDSPLTSRPESYLNPMIRDESDANQSEFILDRDNNDDDEDFVDRDDLDLKTLTMDDQYISITKTINPTTAAAPLSPTHADVPARQTDVLRSQSDQPLSTASPYVTMQSCSVRTTEGLVGSKNDELSRSFSPTSLGVSLEGIQRSATMIENIPLSSKPSPIPRIPKARLRSVTTASMESDVFLNESPSLLPRRPPVPKVRIRSATTAIESESESPQLQPEHTTLGVSSSIPPPLPPTPRARMRKKDTVLDTSQSQSETPPSRRGSSGPVSSMFASSYIQNLFGSSNPVPDERNKADTGDRSSIEGRSSDGEALSPSSSPVRSKGVPSHYDVPRPSTTAPSHTHGSLDPGASNSKLQHPLDPSPTTVPKQSRRTHSETTQSDFDSSSSSPGSPSKAHRRKSDMFPHLYPIMIPEQADLEVVIPRKVRYTPRSSSTKTNPSLPVSTSLGGENIPNPKYGLFGSERELKDSMESTPEVSPPEIPSKYSTMPRLSSSSVLPAKASTSVHPTTPPTYSKAGKGPSSSSNYQQIDHDTRTTGNHYMTISKVTPSDPNTGSEPNKSESTSDPMEEDYQMISIGTRDKHGNYSMLDPKSRRFVDSPLSNRTAHHKNTDVVIAQDKISSNPADEVRKDMKLRAILSDKEFSECNAEICKFALVQEQYVVEQAKEYIRVQLLLDMMLPNISEDDCRRALTHCQHKVDRAAGWLLQMSEQIGKNAQ